MTFRTTFLIFIVFLLILGSCLRCDHGPSKRQSEETAEVLVVNSHLWLAAQNGETAKVKALLERGADVNWKNKDGETVLMRAATMGHVAVVQTLLDEGANVNAKDSDGNTALIKAVSGSIPEDPPLYGKPAKNRALAIIVQALLHKGADINAKNKKGETAMMWANWLRNFEMVQLLHKAGAKR